MVPCFSIATRSCPERTKAPPRRVDHGRRHPSGTPGSDVHRGRRSRRGCLPERRERESNHLRVGPTRTRRHPRPAEKGCTTPTANAVATAASIAFPPASRILRPRLRRRRGESRPPCPSRPDSGVTRSRTVTTRLRPSSAPRRSGARADQNRARAPKLGCVTHRAARSILGPSSPGESPTRETQKTQFLGMNLDDEFLMRGTLSQSQSPRDRREVRRPLHGCRPSSERRHPDAFTWVAAILLRSASGSCSVTALIFFTFGLQRVRSSRRCHVSRILPADARSRGRRIEGRPSAGPTDPSHPILEIEIESPEASGTILVELMPELAPATVINVIELANEGFYDGTTFHRVIPDFMIQGGDPNSRDRDPNNDGKGAARAAAFHDEFSRGSLSPWCGRNGQQRAARTPPAASFSSCTRTTKISKGRYTPVGRVVSRA